MAYSNILMGFISENTFVQNMKSNRAIFGMRLLKTESFRIIRFNGIIFCMIKLNEKDFEKEIQMYINYINRNSVSKSNDIILGSQRHRRPTSQPSRTNTDNTSHSQPSRHWKTSDKRK